MLIRPFRSDDAAAVIAVWERAGLVRAWNDPRKDIDRKLAVADDGFVVGEVDDAVVATMMVGYDGHRGWVNYLAVDPDHQGHGHGRTLMGFAEAWLRARGGPKLNLQVRAGNDAALAFYERLGYAVDAAVSLGKRLEAD